MLGKIAGTHNATSAAAAAAAAAEGGGGKVKRETRTRAAQGCRQTQKTYPFTKTRCTAHHHHHHHASVTRVVGRNNARESERTNACAQR